MRLALFGALALTACATASPRFGQDIATTFAEEDMRHLVTEDVELYYPANQREAAERVAARAAECLRELRSKEVTQRPRARALLFLSSANYNNAYVSGQFLGEPLHSLAPLTTTDELFHWYGLTNADSGDIVCHEMFHYAHFEQVENFWRFINAVVGPVMPSQTFTERWFTEGVAQFYEGRIHRKVGRPNSPLYRGAFDSFVAMRKGSIGAGDLSIYQRELSPFSGAYLTGLNFVEWLAEKYGEDKLWKVMDVQGRSFFTPLGSTLRFKAVFGSSIGALVNQWEDELRSTLVIRERPADQHVVREDLGQLARLAAHAPTGTMAIISAGNEDVPRLRILEADGTVRADRRLTRFTTDREYIVVGPYSMTGLSFTADGRWLFLLNDDLIARGDTRGQIWKIDASNGEVVQVWQQIGRAMGGSVSPDGRAYTFVDFTPGRRARVLERDLGTNAERTLLELPVGDAVSAPQWSPDGKLLAFSRLDGNGWNLVLRREDGTLTQLTTDGAFNYGARWSDPTHLVFARTAGKYLQVHRLDIESGKLEQLTDAPYGVLDPAPFKDQVAFVNRDGVRWSLDVSPANARAVVREQFAGTRVAQVESGEPPAPEQTTATDAMPAPAPVEPPPARHEPPPLVVQEDEEYSSLDQLFVPQLRLPGVLLSTDYDENDNLRLITNVSLSVSGRDRLSKHNWAINAAMNFPTLQSSVNAAYVNMQLAPWYVSASASRDGYADEAYWSGGIFTGRGVFTTPVSFGVRTEIWQPFGYRTHRFIGPTFSVDYGAFESTAYGGVQRQLALSFDASGFPRGLGSDRDMLDLRAGVALAAPLPFSRRHSLTFSLSGRALPGAPEGTLRVGGVGRGTYAWLSQPRDVPRGPAVFLPGPFVEGVRGFDDFAIRATATAILNARYRYAFIIDKGFASTLYLFPSLFFRQIDVEAFGVAAVTDNGSATWARAAGAAITLRAIGGGAIGLSLYGQVAYRFDYALPPLFSAGFAFE